jgi:imidazolonepropionase-like amidohydrolase
MSKRALLPALLLLVTCASQPVAPPSAPETRRYTVLSTKNKAGEQVVTRNGNVVTIDYEWNDRGRGDKTHSVVELDERGIPRSVHIKGNDYFKSPIEERFTLANGTATWKNPAESETMQGTGFYIALHGPAEYQALLARAALADPDGKLDLLPAGTATIHKARELTAGDRRIALYEVSGIDTVPVTIWLDEDRSLFALAHPVYGQIREGYESHLQTLIDAETARTNERLAEIAARQTLDVPTRTVIVKNARIFDPVSLQVSEPTTIEVRGNRIARIGGSAVHSGAHVIDAAGRLAIPGLWDMHSHLFNALDGINDIANGVTGAHDLGNGIETVVDMKKQFDAGTLIGPRLLARALIDGRGPLQAPTTLLISNEQEAREVIDRVASLGFEGIKIYSSTPPDLIPFMTRYAHSKGLKASGHIPAGMTASQAIDAGYDEIHHLNMIFLNFWPEVKETNSPLRFTAIADRGPSLDLKSPEVQSFIEKLKATGTVVDPTLVVFEWIFVSRPGVISPSFAAIAHRLPPTIQRFLKSGGGLPVTPDKDEQHKAAFRKMLELTAELHRSGVTLVSGTDQYAGFALHRELELYSQAGIPNAEVLRIATWNPVKMLGLEKDHGTIEAGKLADFFLVDGDPLRDMSDIRKVSIVLKDGKVFESKKLLAEVGIQ